MRPTDRVYIKRSDGSYALLTYGNIDGLSRFEKIGIRDGLPVIALKGVKPKLTVVK